MIIISQDKTKIINIENLTVIEIDEENNVRVELTNNNVWKIGSYSTKERAEKIMQEIIFNYTREGISEKVQNKIYAMPKVYYMPEK